MTILASSIMTRVRTQLIDLDGTRWSDTELLEWISDACRTIVAADAGASSSKVSVNMVAGTRQDIPDDGHMLLSITRNMTGGTGGRVVRIVSREVVDATDPEWHTANPVFTVQNYMYDPQEPKVFYVYPPNTGQGVLEIIYSVYPAEVTTAGTALVIQDIYQTAVFDYVMFRAHQKDSDFAAGQAVAAMYMQSFMAVVGKASASQLDANPNLQLGPSNPGVRGSAK